MIIFELSKYLSLSTGLNRPILINPNAMNINKELDL